MKFPSTSKGTHLTLLIEFCLHIFLLFAHPSLAQTTSGAATAAPTATTTTPTATSDQSTTTTSTNVFSAIASAHPSNAGLYGVQPGSVGNDPTNQAGENNAGASGGDSSGSINLSTSVIVTIIVIATVVVIIGISTAVLFFLAKRRQWEVRATLRRSARRVTSAFRASNGDNDGNNEAKARSSTRRERGMVRIDPPRGNPTHIGTTGRRQNIDHGVLPGSPRRGDGSDRDVEKGQDQGRAGKVEKTGGMPTAAPQSKFDMESPRQSWGAGQRSRWKGRFGARRLGQKS